ncbi:MAG: PDZ domain-containing protein [Candidatus Saccharibacteria bacterium]
MSSGMNTALASDSQSIGFAIPINDLSGLVSSVEQTGKLQRPYLGVIYVPITSDIVSQYNLSVSNGAYIPTARSGGRDNGYFRRSGRPGRHPAGDIITQVNGTAINQTTSLTSLLDKQKPGDKVSLTINRGGKPQNIDVTLGTAPTSS